MKNASYRIVALREEYKKRRRSPVEVARESLNRIESYGDPAVWITRASADSVMARARELEARRDAFDDLPLYGIPFAVKDNIDAAGFPTTAACPTFAYQPDVSSPGVDRLLAAGAILMGKTNLDQFATGLVGTRSPYGAPRCVFDSRYVSGGSSSGSAVAVAAGLVAFSLGTDTAGSGRVPAAFNNIIGFKPTRGRISTRGMVPACRSADCVSIFTHSIGEACTVLRVAEAYDPADPYSRVPGSVPSPPDALRVGILAPEDREFFGDSGSARLYEGAIAEVAALGWQPVAIDYAPFREAGNLLYGGAWPAERLAAIKDFIATHEADMDPTVHAIIGGARTLSAVDAFESQYRLAELRRAAEAQWARMDVLMLPTVPTHYTVAEVEADPIVRNAHLGRYTTFLNLLDYCAIAVPAGFKQNGLPFGVSFIGPAFADAAITAIAERFLHPEAVPARNSAKAAEDIPVFVAGAHLAGMPLNHELTKLGATLSRAARTAGHYRLYVLPRTVPAKPGLVRDPLATGSGVTGEIWRLSPEAFGRFVAAIPAPLGIGRVVLDDGSSVSGFLCESFAVDGARDITEYGGWRAYTAAVEAERANGP